MELLTKKELKIRWKELDEKSTELLKSHKSFKAYNKVRMQMDEIENHLERLGTNAYRKDKIEVDGRK